MTVWLLTLVVSFQMGEEIGKYYRDLMPILQGVLSHCQDGGLTTLRTKALHCVTLVGTAAGREVFRHDAIQLLQSLVSKFLLSITLTVRKGS